MSQYHFVGRGDPSANQGDYYAAVDVGPAELDSTEDGLAVGALCEAFKAYWDVPYVTVFDDADWAEIQRDDDEPSRFDCKRCGSSIVRYPCYDCSAADEGPEL